MMPLPRDPTDPRGFADLADVEEWLAEDQHARLIAFLAAVEDAPLDVLTAAIRTACTNGFGFWQDPTPLQTGPGTLRPATHLYEIALFGVTGIGHDPDEAARSWRRAALTQAERRVAA